LYTAVGKFETENGNVKQSARDGWSESEGNGKGEGWSSPRPYMYTFPELQTQLLEK
jgi:hypothetical protein